MIADESYIRESILGRPARSSPASRTSCPPYKGQLSEEDVIQLMAYIKASMLGSAAQAHSRRRQ